jgi:hypothetical protein
MVAVAVSGAVSFPFSSKGRHMAKRQLPQTKEGLARVISVILNLYGDGGCRDSECKEGINNLMRAYGRQFCHRKPSRVSVAAACAPDGTDCPEDHVVPVKVLMAHLMGCAKQGRITVEQVMSFLDENSLTCRITAGEDKKLRDARLWNAMPDGSVCLQTGLILDRWARYEHPLVAIELAMQR